MILLLGVLALFVLGAVHNQALLAIRRTCPDPGDRPTAAILSNFASLVVLHTLEIVAFAAVYALVVQTGWIQGFSEDFGHTWQDYVYFSGINYITLGYTQIQAQGDLRLLSMMQSLGGFMVLTWSATFIYTISRKSWDEAH